MTNLRREIITIALAIVGALTIVYLTMFGVSEVEYTYYIKNCTITAVDGDVVSVYDNRGETWNFIGDGFVVGKKVTCKFDNMGTDEIRDDRLINVKQNRKGAE